MKTALLTALALAALSTTALQADDQTMETKVFGGIIPALVDLDYTIHDTELTPLLEQGALCILTIPTNPGQEIVLVGIGGRDSNDIDMFVQRDGYDEIVARDVQTDHMPVCTFIARGGTHLVSIRVLDTDRPTCVRVIFACR